jgi:uncharacterized protein YdgA (DUF945 family)
MRLGLWFNPFIKEGLMKKIYYVVIVLFLLVAVLFSGATFVVGMLAEQHYEEAMQQASQPIYMHLVNESYERGFFRSKARTVVKIRDFGGELASARKEPEAFLGFTLVHDIRHGPLQFGESPEGRKELKPVLAIIETGIELGPETHAKVKEIFAALPEIASMRIYTTLSLAGGGEMRLFIPPFNRTVGKDEKVAVYWKGLTANMAFNADLEEFTGSLSAPGLEAVGDHAEFEMNGLVSNFDAHEALSGLFLGGTSFDLAYLEFAEKKSGQRKQFSMDGIKIRTSSQALTETVNFSMTMNIDGVMTDETPYGPGVCELELRKLDAAALAKLQRVFEELETQFPERSPEEINMMMAAKYLEILPELTRQSPEIEISQLALKTTDGDFWGRARIVLTGTNPAALMNPLLLLNAFTAHAEITIADRLLQRIYEAKHKQEILAAIKQGRRKPVTDAQLQALACAECKKRLKNLVAQNILVHEDKQYKARADYQVGRIVLNGRLLTLQDLMQQR